ncbi:MAG: helix-turn-helix domain-containing protein [Candidatus Woesearchaeota archaeon]
MNTKLLKEIGLTETEIKIYLSLLNLGATSARKIVDDTGVYRKNLYDALNRLIEKGLVSYVIENKIKFFQAKKPENLEKYLDEKKAKIEEQRQEVKKIISEMNSYPGKAPAEIESEIYRGTEGIKTILKECLNYKEVLFIGATGDVENRLPYFWPQYNKKREKLKCKWRLLLVHEAKNKSITQSKYYQYKVLPKILSGLNVIYIYGDYVANILWLEKPLAFVTKHKKLADNYRKYFEYLWKSIK